MPKKRFSKIEAPSASLVHGLERSQIVRPLEPESGPVVRPLVENAESIRSPGQLTDPAPIPRVRRPQSDTKLATSDTVSQAFHPSPSVSPQVVTARSGDPSPTPARRKQRGQHNRRIPSAQQLTMYRARKRLRRAWIYLLILVGIPVTIVGFLTFKYHRF